MSAFLQGQIEKRLKELRHQCELLRLTKADAFRGRWARASRSDEENRRDSGSSDKYWDDLQAKEQGERTIALALADKALVDFIAEHRRFMTPEWPGTDHGRLCWSPYCGGTPIEQRYCQLAEGHEGVHADGQYGWPREVTNDREWHQLRESCAHEFIQYGDDRACHKCGLKQAEVKR